MARPHKQGVDYFPHDTMASSDTKIRMLINQEGIAGYGLYFIILEQIYRTNDNKVDEGFLSLIGMSSMLTIKEVKRMINVIVRIGLFDKTQYQKNKQLVSSRIDESMKLIDGKRKKQREYQEAYETKKSQMCKEDAQLLEIESNNVEEIVKNI